MITVTSVEAQNSFGKLLDTAQREPVVVTRHGRPAALIVSPQDMAELQDARVRRGRAYEALEAWRVQVAAEAPARGPDLTDEALAKLAKSSR